LETSTLRDAGPRLPLVRGPLAVALASVLLVSLLIGIVLASRTSVLHARRLEVSGASSLSRADVLELSGLGRRTNIVWLNDGAAEDRLRQDPWIADAEVSVAFPFTIRIEVTERHPVAVATDGLRTVLIAGDGTALSSTAPARGLPVIQLPAPGTGEGVASSPVGAARALGALSPDLRARVSRVSVRSDGTLEVWLRSGPRVSFGAPTQIGAKARTIAVALAWAATEGERIVALSVVSPLAPAATLAP
jgi:cell division protein FtsQ